MTSIDTSRTSQTDRELLAKAFANSPDASQVVIRIKPTNDSTASHSTSQPIWQDYALYLEQQDSENLKQNQRKQQNSKLTDSSHPRISLWDRSNLSPVNLLTSRLDYVLCSYCKKPILSSALKYHIEIICPNATTKNDNVIIKEPVNGLKKRKWSESQSTTVSPNDTDQEIKTPKKVKKYIKKQKLNNPITSTDLDTTDQSDISPEKKTKKSKKEKPLKLVKSKAPVDVERQCGVLLPNGGLCARSLTCKSHSMGAKRAVQGRSAPYDILLAQYQRKNQVKLATLSTAQQLADENEALGGSTPLNPDEEVRQVMEGVQRAYAIPLERSVIFPTGLKSQFFRMREMFANALLPKGSPPGLGRILGRASAFNPDTPSTLHFVRPPALQRTAYLNQLRQQQLLQQQQQQQQLQQQSQPPQPQAQSHSRQNSPAPR